MSGVNIFKTSPPFLQMKTTPKLPFTTSYNWFVGGQNCIAFCYPNIGPGFAVRGRRDLVLTHVENMGQTVPMVCFFLPYGNEKGAVAKMDVCGLRKGYEVSFIHNARMNPGTRMIERNRRNWLVVYRHKEGQIQGEIVYVKRVRQFHRGWMKELDPFIIGAKVAAPLIHDGNNQDTSKVSDSFDGFSKSHWGPPDFNPNAIPHHKGAFIRHKPIPSNMNAKRFNPKPIVLGNRMKDEFEAIQREAARIEAARIKEEMDAKNAMIRKHREHMLKHLRKMGVVPGVKGEEIDIFEVKEDVPEEIS